MSVSRMFNIGLSGLRAHRQAMNVTGDNIANMNTIGFKGSRVNFRDVLDRSMFGGAGTGTGVEVGSVQKLFSQGEFTYGASPLDMAISGDGFFVVQGGFAGSRGEFYTRAGQFLPDKDGFVVTEHGLRLQGFGFDAAGVRGATRGDIQIPTVPIPAQASSRATIHAQLDARSSRVQAFDLANLAGTSHHRTEVQVFDSLGNSHKITVHFTRLANNDWQWNAVAEGSELTGGSAGPTIVGTGVMQFDTNGALSALNPGSPALTLNFLGATQSQSVALEFGTPLAAGGTGRDGMTLSAAAAINHRVSADGYATGVLEDLRISEDGTLVAYYSNGKDRKIAQLAMAEFTAKEALNRIGGGLYVDTPDSGQPVFTVAGSGKSAVRGGALEASNVDVATEFVTLIQEQRAFSASSRTITTADEIYMETINLKR